MKTIGLIAEIIAIVGVFVGCGGSDPISVVKGGTLEFDESVTVGGALEGYKYFDDCSWSKLEDSQGRQIVEFRGHLDLDRFVDAEVEGIKLTEDVVKRAKDKLPVDLTYVVQFAMGGDGETFRISYSGHETSVTNMETGEGVVEDMPDDEEMTGFQYIYANRPDLVTFSTLLVCAQ